MKVLTFTEDQRAHDSGPLLDVIAERFLDPARYRYYYERGDYTSYGEPDKCCS